MYLYSNLTAHISDTHHFRQKKRPQNPQREKKRPWLSRPRSENPFGPKWSWAGFDDYPDEDFAIMKRLKRNLFNNELVSGFDAQRQSVPRDSEKKLDLRLMRTMGIFVVCLMIFSVLFSVSVVLKDPPSDAVLEASGDHRFVRVERNKGTWFCVVFRPLLYNKCINFDQVYFFFYFLGPFSLLF